MEEANRKKEKNNSKKCNRHFFFHFWKPYYCAILGRLNREVAARESEVTPHVGARYPIAVMMRSSQPIPFPFLEFLKRKKRKKDFGFSGFLSRRWKILGTFFFSLLPFGEMGGEDAARRSSDPVSSFGSCCDGLPLAKFGSDITNKDLPDKVIFFPETERGGAG